MKVRRSVFPFALVSLAVLAELSASSPAAATVTYPPYLQPGDTRPQDWTDQVVIAWQTDEATPDPRKYKVYFGTGPALIFEAKTAGRVVDNYLAADPSLPVPPTAYGAHTDYTAVLRDLQPDTTYTYKVTGPGLPSGGFMAQFKTRKTGDRFSFLVMGDEGFFPVNPLTNNVTNYFARIVHEMYNSGNIALPGQPSRPAGDFALNTGDNVYNTGSEDSYRDFWMPVWNSDVDSVDRGAPFARSIKNYIVVGNHDIGYLGDYVNLLATAGAGPYQGQTGGGDALGYYNNFYFPLNGPKGVDPYYVYNGDSVTETGYFLSYNNITYTSPAAAEAFRASTAVDSGKGVKRQIDHMSNYSFDYGNAHFTFIDSNPHLYDAISTIPSPDLAAPAAFPAYPTVLHDWLINDLDSSSKPWKIVVYHHPAFSSGNATVTANQMRNVTRILDEHGVNIVFNGHEHNYQRTKPLRATDRVALAPTSSGGPAVVLDENFDGQKNIVPDGILHIVEGAGGNRDFDGDEQSPRGTGTVLDQDDSATGNGLGNAGESLPQGPASWLDTNLTNVEMGPFVPNAGTGPKITVNFKAKVFSFGHVVVDGKKLTLYQITEPLSANSSAAAGNPAPYGVDFYGKPMNDPLPDTMINPATGQLLTSNTDGTPALLDKWTIEKPDLGGALTARLVAPRGHRRGGPSSYSVSITNNSQYALNGAQIVLNLPDPSFFCDDQDDHHKVLDQQAVITIGRIEAGEEKKVPVTLDFSRSHEEEVSGVLRSATAQPVAITWAEF